MSRNEERLQRLLRSSLFLNPARVTDRPHWLGHVPFAYWLVDVVQPSVLVELGTETGVSYCAFCQAVKHLSLQTRCFAIDTWEGDTHTERYGEEVYTDFLAYHDAHYSGFSQVIRSSFQAARDDFEDGSIDLLHIDGCHEYEAVKNDFESWRDKLSDSGVVLLHDTAVREGDFGVWRLWEEVSQEYPSLNFEHSHGLGVLLAGERPAEGLAELVGLMGRERTLAKALFSRLGDALVQGWWAGEADKLNRRLQAMREALEEAKALAFGRLQENKDLDRRLQGTLDALEETKRLALERLQQIMALDKQLQATNAGLDDAKKLAFERLDEIAELHRRLEATAEELEVAKGLAGAREAENE